MVTCKICLKELENNKGLSYHASQVHNKKFCDYLVEFEYGGKWPTCECGCGQKVNFFGGKFAKHVGSHGIIGSKRTEETRKKISKVQRGRKLTKSHIDNIKNSLKNRFNLDEDLKKRISNSLLGRKKTDDHKKNISKTRKKMFESGDIKINKDKVSLSITQLYLEGGFAWCKGQHTSSKTGKTFNYRSSWEKQYMEMLDSDPDVIEWDYEFQVIKYEMDGEIRRYLPDFLVHYSDGTRKLVEVKPGPLRDTKMNEAKRSAALRYCEENCLQYEEWGQ